jgi:glycosyltransferase involved in cell wall biosynthesis
MDRDGAPRVSVVVPTRNETAAVVALLPEIAAVGPIVHEVVVADAGSPGDTMAAARSALGSAKVVAQTRTGKGNALACGFAAATGNIVVTFDADGRADPAQIPDFVAALLAGSDVVAGSRFAAGGRGLGFTRLGRARAAVLNRVASGLFGATRTDLGFGYHAFWVDVLPTFDLPSIIGPAAWGDGAEIDTVLGCRAAAAGHRLTEVAAVERLPARGAHPRRTAADDRRVLRELLTERRRSRRPAPAEPVRLPPP